MEYKEIRAQGHEFSYKWPFYFLIASSFWNFLGAGVFGFLISTFAHQRKSGVTITSA